MEIIDSSKYNLTYICSPLSMGDFNTNIRNTERYCRLFTNQGFNPIAPHIYYTRFLDDTILEERNKGIQLGLQLLSLCDSLFVIVNNGISKGMSNEIKVFNSNPIQRDIYFIYFTDLKSLEYNFKLVRTNVEVKEVMSFINLADTLKQHKVII